jgi:23S rRNA pseudouridine1911/1915/1917 synthase
MNADTLIRTVPAELAGQRLDQALARLFPEYSRSRLKSWLLDGALVVDGASPRPRDPVEGGETVTLKIRPEAEVTAQPESMTLDIVYEDDALLVVNKPAGLVVHPGAGNPAGTLLNGLLHHAESLEELPRGGIIHRLDKDTSGLLLVAKSLPAHTALTRALAAREIARHYVAVCCGVLTGGGTIKAPIGRHRTDRKRMCVRDDGRPAVTHYTVIERFVAHTYIHVRLETGRTHQIRVHFAHRRQPLLGDPVYGGRLALPKGASEPLIQALRNFRRQALHATRLEFAHPETTQTLSFEAPLPDDFANLLEALRGNANVQ